MRTIKYIFIIIATFTLFNLVHAEGQAASCNSNNLITVRFKQSGNKVKNLQLCLTQAGYSFSSGATGYYGIKTKTVIKLFYLKELHSRISGQIFGLSGISRLKQLLLSSEGIKSTSATPPATSPNPTPSPSTQINPIPSSSIPVTMPTTPVKQSFTTNADDSNADLTNISVSKGATVEITFNVKSTGVYFGGLDFRSDTISTGTILSGNSKTISFIASNSFSFIPYWPSSGIRKSYSININVQ